MVARPSLQDYLLPADETLALPIDELAVRLLAYLSAAEDAGEFPHPSMLDQWNLLQQRAARYEELRRALCEAWDWLLMHGLLSSWLPGQRFETRFAFVTRRGREVITRGLSQLRAEQRIDIDLHPRIADRIRSQFLLGEIELAALAAMREVEIRVRELAGASDSDIGVKLMADAFNPKGGPLFDPSLDPGESEHMMALFRGAIGVFKNPSSHRQVEYDDVTAGSEVVLFADLLLRLLDGVEEAMVRRQGSAQN